MAGLPNLELTPLDAWRIMGIMRSGVQQLAPYFRRFERRQATVKALDLLEKDGVIPAQCRTIQRIPEPSEREKKDLDYLLTLIEAPNP